jgi:hypothetical protein
VSDSEVPFTNLLRRDHHWPYSHAQTLTRLTLTSLTLISLIMRLLTILFPVIWVRINCPDAEPSREYNARKQQAVREIYQRAFVAAGLLET